MRLDCYDRATAVATLADATGVTPDAVVAAIRSVDDSVLADFEEVDR